RAAARDDARRPLHGADRQRARAVEADRPDAGAEQRRAEVDVDLAGDGHLHDVERGRVGDAPAADLLHLQAEALREPVRPRPAAVDDGDLRAALGEFPDVGSERGELGPRDHLAADLDDDYGHEPRSSSEAFSSTPSMRFMFWIAWPAPPLMRLSVTAKQVTVRRSPWSAPTERPTSA